MSKARDIADLDFNAPDIDGGNIDGAVIGATTAAASTFTDVVAASLDISGNIDVDGTTNLDVVDIDGAVDMASTLAVGGVVTANAGVVVDNITIDGTQIDLSSGDLTLDVAGSIILDADSDGRTFFFDGGTEYGLVGKASNSLFLKSSISDGDILFQGNDGGSAITALTLDMSDGGEAYFAKNIHATSAFLTKTNNDPNLTLITTDADANAGPSLVLDRNSASPADGDVLGQISFNGKNDAAEAHNYAKIEARIVDASNATEDGRLELMTSVATEEGISRILMNATQTVVNDNSKDLDFRVESDNMTHALFVQGNDGKVGVFTAAPRSTLEVGSTNSKHGIQLNGGPNGTATQIHMIDGKGGAFTTLTIDVQLGGAGGYMYQVQVAGTAGCKFQAGGGYTNSIPNFSHHVATGSGFTVTSPSNNLIRLVAQSGVGTHPVCEIKMTQSLNANHDQDNVTITWS